MYTSITVFLLVALIFYFERLLFFKFRRLQSEKDRGFHAYVAWLKERFLKSFSALKDKRLFNPFMTWLKQFNPKKFPRLGKWLWPLFVITLGILVLTGFSYALLSPARLHGYPLLIHVAFGGVYAVCLSAVCLFCSAAFSGSAVEPAKYSSGGLIPPLVGRVGLGIRWSFWILVASGLLLVLSTVSSMMPLFSQAGLDFLFDLHRYTALTSLLAFISLVYLIRFHRFEHG